MVGLCLCLFVGAQEQPDNRPQLTVRRDNKTIRVIQTDVTSAQGAQFIPQNPTCEDDTNMGIIFAPEPGYAETLVNDTRITSAIAFLRRPKGTQEQEVLELLGGSLTISNDTLCPEEVLSNDEAEVTLYQGRTVVSGESFVYENATGIGVMEGAIVLNRRAEGDSAGLDASAKRLEYNADNDSTLLSGGVTITSGDRVSEAESVDYNEKDGIAILTGNPARSKQGDDVLKGSIILYYLDSNDVVVKGEIEGDVTIDLQ